MIFVDSLASVDTAENRDGEEELDHSDGGLEDDQDNGSQTEDAVRGNEVRVVSLVYFDDDEGAQETQDAEQLDAVVDACAQQFLVGSGGWLQDESCLDLQEESRTGQQLKVD